MGFTAHKGLNSIFYLNAHWKHSKHSLTDCGNITDTLSFP